MLKINSSHFPLIRLYLTTGDADERTLHTHSLSSPLTLSRCYILSALLTPRRVIRQATSKLSDTFHCLIILSYLLLLLRHHHRRKDFEASPKMRFAGLASTFNFRFRHRFHRYNEITEVLSFPSFLPFPQDKQKS